MDKSSPVSVIPIPAVRFVSPEISTVAQTAAPKAFNERGNWFVQEVPVYSANKPLASVKLSAEVSGVTVKPFSTFNPLNEETPEVAVIVPVLIIGHVVEPYVVENANKELNPMVAPDKVIGSFTETVACLLLNVVQSAAAKRPGIEPEATSQEIAKAPPIAERLPVTVIPPEEEIVPVATL